MTNLEKYARQSPYFPAFKVYCRKARINIGAGWFDRWYPAWKGFEAGCQYHSHAIQRKINEQTLGVPIEGVCPRCEGSKIYNSKPCSVCNGTGLLSEAINRPMTGIPDRAIDEWVE